MYLDKMDTTFTFLNNPCFYAINFAFLTNQVSKSRAKNPSYIKPGVKKYHAAVSWNKLLNRLTDRCQILYGILFLWLHCRVLYTCT